VTPEDQPTKGCILRWIMAGSVRFTVDGRLLGLAGSNLCPEAQFRDRGEVQPAKVAGRVTGVKGRAGFEKTTRAAMLMRTPLPL
jgi:hypothetical protein